MEEGISRHRFEEAALPHLDAAYNLARWLTSNEQDAEDVVQEAYFRALKFFESFRGGDIKAWLLTIVRRTCYTWLQTHRGRGRTVAFDEAIHGEASEMLNPENLLYQRADQQMVRDAIAALPDELREVIVLRELEELSYRDIAEIASIPMGTVMSRLARGRRRLQERLSACLAEEE